MRNILGIIIEDRWKLIKGGYPGYGYYDYHWGKEENAKPNPEYNFDDVLSSPASKAIESLPEYKNVLNRINALKLRSESAVKCKSPENKIPVQNGFVRPSDRFRCEKFCLFDVIDDPCELNVIVNDEIVQMGKAILAKHKKHMIFQSVASVDPDSNPLNFGGVWMPWDHKKRADSFAQSLASPLFYLFLFIAFTWYLVRGL